MEKEIEQEICEQVHDMPENTEGAAKRFCTACGAQLRDNVKFCTKCGTRIEHRKADIGQQHVDAISEKRINKIAVAAIVVIAICVVSVIAGVFVYTRIQHKNVEKAEDAVANMQDFLIQQQEEQRAEDLPKQQKEEQFDTEIAQTDNEKADEAQNAAEKTQNNQEATPQVIQIDSRYIKTIQASSELTDSTKTYQVESVLDGDRETCWSEGVSGTGEGEVIYIAFTNPVYIAEVAFLNGYMKDENVYNANGKIKRAKLGFDEDSYEVEFDDWQYQEVEGSLYSDRFMLDSPVRTQSLSITISEAQKGTKYDDICLTELAIWGYADEADGNLSMPALPAGETDIYDLYNNVIDEVALIYGSDCEYALYDLDHDGTVELITSQGTNNADWFNTVYTVDNSGILVEVGTFYGVVSLYAAENGNGIYSVYGHMGDQEMEWITKDGNELYTETILSGDVGSIIKIRFQCWKLIGILQMIEGVV